MLDFRRALTEINVVRNLIILFVCLLDAAVVFLAVYLGLTLIHFYPLLSFVPSIIYFILKSKRLIREKSLREVEKTHPVLHERLRTAADTLDQQNVMVLRLRASVLSTLRTVGISSFFDSNYLMKKIASITVLSFVILIVSLYGLHIFDLQGLISDPHFGESLRDRLLGTYLPESLRDFRLSDLNRDQEVGDINNQMNLRNAYEDEFSTGLPSEIFKGSDTSFEESISKKKRIYIRNYFGKVRDIEES